MVKISDIELPMIFKNKLLFSDGFHNSWNITTEEILKSFQLTDWEDQRNRSLFLSHSERDAESWLGRIANPYIKNGQLFGDLEVHDANLAMKLGPGKAPMGVSAEIKWPPQFNEPTDFTYRGFAMVPNPGVTETMVNFSKENDGKFNTATIHTPFVENKANFSDEEKEEIKEMIKEETREGDESDLMSAERGLNKMEENNANNVAPEEEVKTEEVEVVEAPTEEAKEEEVTEEVKESKEADFSAIDGKIEALSARVIALEEKQAKFSAEAEKAEEVKDEAEAEVEVKEEASEEVEEVVETKETPEEEVKEEAPAEEAKADFSELANKIDKLASAIAAKEAAPMSTAEFGTTGNDRGTAVIDRLTKFLE